MNKKFVFGLFLKRDYVQWFCHSSLTRWPLIALPYHDSMLPIISFSNYVLEQRSFAQQTRATLSNLFIFSKKLPITYFCSFLMLPFVIMIPCRQCQDQSNFFVGKWQNWICSSDNKWLNIHSRKRLLEMNHIFHLQIYFCMWPEKIALAWGWMIK